MAARTEAKFHIWETVFGTADTGNIAQDQSSVGHASMELPNGEYVSVRPKNCASVNPFTLLFPVHAQNVRDLPADVEIEGRRPDRTISVPLTEAEVQALTATKGRLVDSMESGQRKYQLLPEFGFLSAAKATVAQASRFRVCDFFTRSDPVRRVASTEATHCSDAIAGALNDAGVHVPVSKAPWRITPSDLGNWLEQLRDRL